MGAAWFSGVAQLTLPVTAARSAVTRLHIEARPGPLVVAVLPATYRAASRAASDVSMAKAYPRPISSTPAMSTISTGRASESSTRAWPRPLPQWLRIEIEAGHDHPRDLGRSP